MSRLRISLLGAPLIEAENKLIELNRRKALALLAYLALTNKPQRREALATMFWSEFDPERARAALRQVLWEISTTPLRPFLQIRRENVALEQTENLWIDVRRFRDLLSFCQSHSHAATNECQTCSENLTEAVQLYRGEFLDGFSLRDGSLEFDEWQLLQSQSLRDDAVKALTQLVSTHDARGEFNLAIPHARQLLALNPTEETVYRQLMRLYALTKQRATALRYYNLCVKTLRQELNESPQAATICLYENIKTGKFPASQANETSVFDSNLTAAIRLSEPSASNNDHNFTGQTTFAAPQLSLQTTAFLGRESELAEIAERLNNPYCRLLTLLGAGGVGKTRLAVQAVKQSLESFGNNVCFVSLAAVNSPVMLLSSLADALGMETRGQSEIKVQLFDFLADKQLLLVLDNFDHLLDAADVLAEILERTEKVKILATSRERLSLRAEWLLELEGLKFPNDESAVDSESYSAVQLFLQTAERANAKFAASVQERQSIARICRIVEGLPLGIELAASWVHTLSCQQIAAEVERSLDLLTTTLRDVPAEHRSIRAVFERSWNFLSEAQRQALRMMSVFRGGFRADAAEFVANAGLPTLSALLDKSLLRRTAPERYEMHQLIRQFGEEKLRALPDEEFAARELHCNYYSKRFGEMAENDFHEQRTAWGEVENARAGWHWAISHCKIEEIEQYINFIFRFYDLRGWFQEGYESFAQAANNLRQALEIQPNERQQILLGRLLMRQGIFSVLMGKNEEADRLLRDGLELLGEADLPTERAQCLNRLGIVVYHLGDYRAAKDYLEQALTLYRELKDPRGIAQSLNRLAYLAGEVKDYSEAERLLEESLQINQRLNRKKEIVDSLNDLGYALYLGGKNERAARLLEESLDLSKAIGYRRAIASTLDNLGCVAMACDKLDEARQYFQEALKVSIEIRAIPLALDVVAGMATLLARENGKEEQAIKLLVFAINHSATWKVTKENAQNLLSELEGKSSKSRIAAFESNEQFEINDVISLLK